MKIKSPGCPLIALKNKLSAALILGSIGLLVAPAANAQLIFTVDAFTNDSISITFNNSTLSLLGNSTPTQAHQLFLIDADNPTNMTWIDDDLEGPLTEDAGFGQIGSVGVVAITAANGMIGDVLVFNTAGFTDLVAGTSVTTPFTHSVSQAGLFTSSNITNFALYWGAPNGDGILQSIGLASAGSSSTAVPEPSTYAAIFGILALSGAFLRRRTRLS